VDFLGVRGGGVRRNKIFNSPINKYFNKPYPLTDKAFCFTTIPFSLFNQRKDSLKYYFIFVEKLVY